METTKRYKILLIITSLISISSFFTMLFVIYTSNSLIKKIDSGGLYLVGFLFIIFFGWIFSAMMFTFIIMQIQSINRKNNLWIIMKHGCFYCGKEIDYNGCKVDINYDIFACNECDEKNKLDAKIWAWKVIGLTR